MNIRLVSFLTLGAVLSVPALANTATTVTDPTATQSVSVGFADLDVNSQSGAEQLYRRIAKAAETVCDSVGSDNLTRYMSAVRCRQNAIDHAVGNIHSSPLTAVNEQHRRLSPQRDPGVALANR